MSLISIKSFLRVGASGAVCALAATLLTGSVHRPAHRHIPAIVHERHGQMETSTNWSGYAVEGAAGSFSDVKGSWQVPSVTCPATGDQYASLWVGIDGDNSNTVEQIGTDSDCVNGSPSYYAWYEFYPHPSYNITSLQIHAGDVVSAEVSYSAAKSGNFTVTLTNVTTNAQPVIISTKEASAKRSSVEWIVEAPWEGGVLPLSNFGTAYFGQQYNPLAPGTCYYTGANGKSVPIGPFSNGNVVELTMTGNNGQVKAQPSALTSDSSSFSDAWMSTGP